MENRMPNKIHKNVWSCKDWKKVKSAIFSMIFKETNDFTEK